MTIRYLRMAPALATVAVLFFSGAGGVQAQQKSTADAIAEYRASLQDGNPADTQHLRKATFATRRSLPITITSC